MPRWDPPPGVPPGSAGALVDQRADTADVLATILDLARRGWLTIREIHPSGVPAEGPGVPVLREVLSRVGLWETEWEFTMTGRSLDGLAPHEKAAFAALFVDGPRVGATALSRRLRGQLSVVYAALYDDLIRRGWFLSRPDRVRRDWWWLAAGFGGAAALTLFWGGDGARAAALALSGAVVALAAPAMPAATRAGARARSEALGVTEYLRRAEKAEIEARHAGERTPERFDALLPWAIALGVTELWLADFEGLLPAERPWYRVEGPTAGSLAVQIGGFLAVAGLLLESGEPGGL